MKQLLKLIILKIICPSQIKLFPLRMTVASGPFAGMKYLNTSIGSSLAAKILGTYEKELHSTIFRILSLSFVRVVNVGAGEGYYAVGLAFSHPSRPRVVAFESNATGQKTISSLAELNQVQPILINGFCDAENLTAAICDSQSTLIVCDVEGFEKDLLNPETVTGLSKAWILVEVHDFIDREIGTLLKDRFRETHSILEIWSETRNTKDLPHTNALAKLLPTGIQLRAMAEGRPERMRWFWMEPQQNQK